MSQKIYSSNAYNIELSEGTKKLLIVKAKVSDLYEQLSSVIAEEEPIESPESREVKDALLVFSDELMKYIAMKIDEKTIDSGYTKL